MRIELRTLNGHSLGNAAAMQSRKILAREAAESSKSAAEMRAEHVVWRDLQETRTSCLFCGWVVEGTAAEGRQAALEHRKAEHPERAVRKPRRHARMSKRSIRTSEEEAQITIDAAAARRVRAEREDAVRLATIGRGRLRRGEEEAA